jgi:hypothetical protein
VQIAAEVANAELTVQTIWHEAATAARELAQKRLEAEQSRPDVGMTTNLRGAAQRDLRDAANVEPDPGRLPQVARESSARSRRRRAARGGLSFAATGGQ